METKLPRSSAEAERVDPSAILALIETFEKEKLNTHSLMVLRHGKVISETWWEPYRQQENHLLYSLTKSFASTAVGFAISEGLFGLDDLVIDLLPEQKPTSVSDHLSKMAVRHLLSMSTGHETEPDIQPREGTWESCASVFLEHPVSKEPETHFLYNTAASNMLSILVQKFSGEPLDEYLDKRLFRALGISHPEWTRGQNFVWGGSGLHTTTESVAKLGLLYLNHGQWNGEQLLPVGWAELATSFQVSNGSEPDNDWNQGYGFQFWRCRNNAFRGDGAFGQFCLVLPEFDAVVAITSGDSDMQKVLNSIWSILLPAFDSGAGSDLVLPKQRSLPPLESVEGQPSVLSLKGPGFELELQGLTGRIEHLGHIEFSLHEWTEFEYAFGREALTTARAKGGWIAPTTLEVAVWNVHTPQAHHFLVETDGTVSFKETGFFSPNAPEFISCQVTTKA